MMKSNSPTRGKGILEEFLAHKRADQANLLIPKTTIKDKLLDLGCGQFPYFLSNADFSQKYGIDPSLNLKSVGEGIHLSRKAIDKEKLPYKTDFFNVVTMLAVFEHIEKDRLNFVLEEILRVLQQKGILIITTPSPWSDRILHQMTKIGLISSEEIHDHKSHYDKKTIVDIIKQAGFNGQNIESGYFELGFNMWFKAVK